MNKAVQTYYH